MWRSLRNLLVFLLFVAARPALAQSGGELHFCLHGEPKTFNPILVDDEASENIRYLTGGVLIRLNRQTQALEPGLATSWRVSKDGRSITFHLRKGLHFSDGTAFTSEDVAYTMRLLMDPQLHSPTGDAFRSSEGKIGIQTPSGEIVTITFPAPVAGLERLFDQVAILSAHSPQKEMTVLGPFYVSEYKAGSYVQLRKNPNYWKHDAQGRALPYLDGIRLDIQRNRDIELLRFRRGELQLINRLDAEYFQRLQQEDPGAARNAGGTTSAGSFSQAMPSPPMDRFLLRIASGLIPPCPSRNTIRKLRCACWRRQVFASRTKNFAIAPAIVSRSLWSRTLETPSAKRWPR